MDDQHLFHYRLLSNKIAEASIGGKDDINDFPDGTFPPEKCGRALHITTWETSVMRLPRGDMRAEQSF